MEWLAVTEVEFVNVCEAVTVAEKESNAVAVAEIDPLILFVDEMETVADIDLEVVHELVVDPDAVALTERVTDVECDAEREPVELPVVEKDELLLGETELLIVFVIDVVDVLVKELLWEDELVHDWVKVPVNVVDWDVVRETVAVAVDECVPEMETVRDAEDVLDDVPEEVEDTVVLELSDTELETDVVPDIDMETV